MNFRDLHFHFRIMCLLLSLHNLSFNNNCGRTGFPGGSDNEKSCLQESQVRLQVSRKFNNQTLRGGFLIHAVSDTLLMLGQVLVLGPNSPFPQSSPARHTTFYRWEALFPWRKLQRAGDMTGQLLRRAQSRASQTGL